MNTETTPANEANKPEPELRDKVLSALRWTVLGRFAAQALRWGSTIIVIRFLMPADYGVMSMVEVLFSLLITLAGSGLADGLVKEKHVSKATERAMLSALLTVSIGLAIFQWFAAPLVARWFNEPAVIPVLQLLVIPLVLLPWFTLPMAMLKQEMRFKELALVEFFSALLASVVTLTMAILGYGIWALVMGQIAAISCRVVGFAYVRGGFTLPGGVTPEVKPLLKFGLLVAATGLLWTVYARVDVFIGGRRLSTSEIGFYAVALDLAALAMSRLMPLVHQVGFPSYAQLDGDAAAAGRYLRKTMRLLALLVCPVFIGLAAIADPFVRLVLGDGWLPLVPLLMVLCATMPVRMAMQLYGPGLRALNRAELPLYDTVASLAISATVLWFVVDDSAMDIAIAWVIAIPLCALVTHWLASLVFKVRLRSILADLLPPLMLAAAMFALVYGYVEWVGSSLPTTITLVTAIVIGGVFYAGTGWLLIRGRMKEALELVRKG